MSVECVALYPPLPMTRRGYRVSFDATAKKTARYAYCSGHAVFIREFDGSSEP